MIDNFWKVNIVQLEQVNEEEHEKSILEEERLGVQLDAVDPEFAIKRYDLWLNMEEYVLSSFVETELEGIKIVNAEFVVSGLEIIKINIEMTAAEFMDQYNKFFSVASIMPSEAVCFADGEEGKKKKKKKKK